MDVHVYVCIYACMYVLEGEKERSERENEREGGREREKEKIGIIFLSFSVWVLIKGDVDEQRICQQSQLPWWPCRRGLSFYT